MAHGSNLLVQLAMRVPQQLPGSVPVKYLGAFVNNMGNGQSNLEYLMILLRGSGDGEIDKSRALNQGEPAGLPGPPAAVLIALVLLTSVACGLPGPQTTKPAPVNALSQPIVLRISNPTLWLSNVKGPILVVIMLLSWDLRPIAVLI